ncbi:hypothetical protein OC844_000842 [Tilletia horrida]|nr:hypothetical protein OC844_000842 [Tilletia horrida]
MYQQPLPALRTSFSGPSGTSGSSTSGGPPTHSSPYSSYGGGAQSGPPPLPSPAAPSGHAGPPMHSPMAPDMAAWGNAQGGARPHTADAVFGNGYGGFGPAPVNGPPGAHHLPPPNHKGPSPTSYGSGRMFAYMPSADDSPGADVAYGHPTAGPGASPYGGSYSTASSLPYSSTPGTANSTAPSSAGTGASLATTHKKRPRRRYDEIERLYPCNWPGCTKSYGTLNHLNAHVAMQKHGAKRLPNEFKDMRRAWRKAKREEDQRRQSTTQAQLKEQEEAMFRGRMGSLPNPGAYYPPPPTQLAPGGMYPPPVRTYGSYPPAPTDAAAAYHPPPSGTSSSSGNGGHMLPPMPGRSYSMGTAGYGIHPTGMAATAANGGTGGGGSAHDHYTGSHGGGGGGYGGASHGYQHQQPQQQQSSAPASSAGPTGASGLGAYLMAHRGSI